MADRCYQLPSLSSFEGLVISFGGTAVNDRFGIVGVPFEVLIFKRRDASWWIMVLP